MIDDFVRTVIKDMDFIGIVERMDKSLVLLSLMLNLVVTDVLYINSKLSGGYMNRPGEYECRRIGYPRPLLPAMNNFLNSTDFTDLMKIDNALYDAVNQKM